ncbi:alpha/beta hydrolase fold domain-containing protein [Nocardia tengchongensis]|uniref:alpha/beta hydrolase fold domain-containing protein n=1 Tax=Nocardia tengchongensis TaxID=2055889 RepID=UPI0036B37EB7
MSTRRAIVSAVTAVAAVAITRRVVGSADARTSRPVTALPETGRTGFTGEPSRLTRGMLACLGPVRAVADLLGLDMATQLTPLMAATNPPWLSTKGLQVHREQLHGMPVVTIRPPTCTGKVVVAMHGGAYVVQPTVLHWLDYTAMARDTGAIVVVPLYPLAGTPQGCATKIVPALTDLVTAQIAEHGGANVSVYGDSAGGGLALAVAQELARRSATGPSHLVLISPWLDVSMTNPAIPAIDDPVLSLTAMRASGKLWAADLPTTDPLVSPLHGPLTGLPPTAVYAGSLDILSADALLLREKALAQGAEFTFVLRAGLVHDWALGGLPFPSEGPAVRPDIYRQLGLVN